MAQNCDIFADGGRHKSFTDFYEQICSRIRENGNLNEIMKDFEKFKTDFERVKYVFNMEEVKNLHIEALEGKNAEKAREFENEYDRLNVTEEDAFKAKCAISKSIQATPIHDTETLAVRFMKRGWSSLLLERFDEALIDAQRSLSFEAPSSLIWNAHEILGHCYAKQNLNKQAEAAFKRALEGLRNSDISNEMKATSTKRISIVFKSIKGRKDIKEKRPKEKDTANVQKPPKVSYSPHEILESATNAVEVIKTKETGRGLYASKEILPGDIIIVEEPFVSVSSYECLNTHCNACFKQVDTPLPCPTCSSVWFCDEKCLSEGKSGLHKHECKIILHLYDTCIGKMALLVFRILQKATWKRLKLLRDASPELLPKNLLPSAEISVQRENGGWLGHRKQYLTQDYLSTLHLVTNDDKRSFGDLFKRSLSAIYILGCLRVADFFEEEVNDEDILYVASLALCHLQGSSCNAYAIAEYVTGDRVNLDSTEGKEIGGGIYPTVSLTNHSCCPNTFRYSMGTTCILRATQIINKGSEIFDNYGPQFQAMPLTMRKELLQQQYKFNCECPACLEDWPLYPDKKEHITFACPEPNCGQPCPYSGDTITQCPFCAKSKSFANVIKNIKNRLNAFNKGLSNLSKGNAGKALPILLNHQIFLQKTLIPLPGKHMMDVQEALKRTFLAEGNVIRSEIG